MEISAKDVMKLRQMTGAGMMDCKKALAESNGSLDEAVDFLRKKGLKTAEKRADREANEGKVVCLLADDGRAGVLLELNSETDFVAGTPDFRAFALDCAAQALAKRPADVEALLDLPAVQNPAIKLADQLSDMVGKLGEKMGVRRFCVLAIPAGRQGKVHTYIHLGDKHGVIIAVACDKPASVVAPAFQELVNDLALQVVAYTPKGVDRDSIDPAVVEHELNLYREMIRAEGKPEQMVDKIAQGKLNKFYAESTLLEQAFLKEEKSTVHQVVDQLGKQLDDKVVVESFAAFIIGQ
ncbi:MAG: translation elongation factor Ts [Candidatus Delongbacteria bacterium]